MAETSTIEWTDATWNPITGCSLASPGCTHCYAMTLAGGRLRNHPSRARLTQETKAGPVWTGEVRFNEAWLAQPARWGRARRIFVCAHGDLFHESVPDEWIDRVWATMAVNTRHTFQVLTKRSARMRAYVGALQARLGGFMSTVAEHPTGARPLWDLIDVAHFARPLPNDWPGVSAEDQTRADERIPDLLLTPATVRVVSVEPMLGPVSLRCFQVGETRVDALTGGVQTRRRYPGNGLGDFEPRGNLGAKLDQVILGGESGPRARPMHPEWARQVRDECAATGTAFLFKQWGSWAPTEQFDCDPSAHAAYAGELLTMTGHESGPAVFAFPATYTPRPELLRPIGKALAGRVLDGRTHDAMPGAPA